METIEGIPVGAQLGADWDQVIARWATEDRVCVRCGLLYKEIENLGTWRCSQHAWPEPQGPRWTCCGQVVRVTPSPVVKACVRADHCDLPGCREWTTEHDRFLPNELIPTLGAYVFASSVTDGTIHWEAQGFPGETQDQLLERSKHTVLRRYDWRKAREITERTKPPHGASSDAIFYHT